MTNLPAPNIIVPYDAPPYLAEMVKYIQQYIDQRFAQPVRLRKGVSTDRPLAARWLGCLVYETDTAAPVFSDGTVWNSVATSSGYVATSRQILSGTGLSGGGNLTADRTLSIANTIAAAGPVGDSSHVAQITFNAQGQLTTVSSVAIASSVDDGALMLEAGVMGF